MHVWNNIRTKKFELFDIRSQFSGATVLTCAVAKALRAYVDSGKKLDLASELTEELLNFGWKYPDINYGRNFLAWLFADEQTPYGSAGAGSAMRGSGTAPSSNGDGPAFLAFFFNCPPSTVMKLGQKPLTQE